MENKLNTGRRRNSHRFKQKLSHLLLEEEEQRDTNLIRVKKAEQRLMFLQAALRGQDAGRK